MPTRSRVQKRKTRKARRIIKSRKASRRFVSRRLRRGGGRLQSGGGHKEDIIELITSNDNFPTAYEFFQSMDQPTWHSQFPKIDGSDYIVLIHEGEGTDQDQQKILLIKLKKLADNFAEVTMETFDEKKPQEFLDQYRADLLQSGAEYTGIRDASREIFDVAA